MAPDLILPRPTVFGRPLRPVSLFVTVLGPAIIAYANVANTGILQDSVWGDALAGAMAAVIALGMVGWWLRSKQVAEIALLASSFAWGARFWAGFLVTGFSLEHEGLWLSICWAGVAAGSWFLERADPRGH